MYIYSLRMLRDIRFIRTKYQLHKQAKKNQQATTQGSLSLNQKSLMSGLTFVLPCKLNCVLTLISSALHPSILSSEHGSNLLERCSDHMLRSGPVPTNDN